MTPPKRVDPRVSIFSNVLISNSQFLHRTHALNISLTGLFLENIPFVLDVDALDLIIELPEIPYLGEMQGPELYKKVALGFENWAFPCHVTVARKVDDFKNVDQIFKLGIGARFLNIDDQVKEKLSEFILNMIKNIHVLLRLIQQARPQERDLILQLAQGLGYPPGLKYSELHLRVLKDYQALNW